MPVIINNFQCNKEKIIPPPILYIEKKIKLKEYLILKNDTDFRNKLAKMCENCVLSTLEII